MTEQQPVLPAEPWYASEVQVRLIAAGAAQLVSVLFRLVDLFGYELRIAAADVDAIGANLTQIVTLIALGLAVMKRGKSPVAPLTLTDTRAKQMNAANPPLLDTNPTKTKETKPNV